MHRRVHTDEFHCNETRTTMHDTMIVAASTKNLVTKRIVSKCSDNSITPSIVFESASAYLASLRSWRVGYYSTTVYYLKSGVRKQERTWTQNECIPTDVL